MISTLNGIEDGGIVGLGIDAPPLQENFAVADSGKWKIGGAIAAVLRVDVVDDLDADAMHLEDEK
jgi:hypothetical protein